MSSADEQREMQKKSWNKFSGGWKKWDELVMAWLSETGDVLLNKANLKDGDMVMDMSTGTGEPGLTAAEQVGSGQVIGVDLAEDMLAVADEKSRARGIANYHTRVFDGLNVPFDDAHFNAVICRFGVIFSPEPESLLAEMVRVTRPGGRVSVSS